MLVYSIIHCQINQGCLASIETRHGKPESRVRHSFCSDYCRGSNIDEVEIDEQTSAKRQPYERLRPGARVGMRRHYGTDYLRSWRGTSQKSERTARIQQISLILTNPTDLAGPSTPVPSIAVGPQVSHASIPRLCSSLSKHDNAPSQDIALMLGSLTVQSPHSTEQKRSRCALPPRADGREAISHGP